MWRNFGSEEEIGSEARIVVGRLTLDTATHCTRAAPGPELPSGLRILPLLPSCSCIADLDTYTCTHVFKPPYHIPKLIVFPSYMRWVSYHMLTCMGVSRQCSLYLTRIHYPVHFVSTPRPFVSFCTSHTILRTTPAFYFFVLAGCTVSTPSHLP